MVQQISTQNSEDYFVLALYGIKASQTSAQGFYKATVDWFRQTGYFPDKLSVHGSNYSGNFASFKRTNTKLKSTGFDAIRGFTIASFLPDGKAPLYDYRLIASYDADPEGVYALMSCESNLLKFSETSLPSIALSLIRILEPEYGIGYFRSRKLGPVLYAIGLSQGLSREDYEEGVNIAWWGSLGMVDKVYQQGLLRDVYQWNVLSLAQLSFPIGCIPLKEWITQSSTRGLLSQITEENYLWKLENCQLMEVRIALKEANIIFDWQAWLAKKEQRNAIL